MMLLISKFIVLICCAERAYAFYCQEPCIPLDAMTQLSFSQNGYAIHSDGQQSPQLDCVEGNGCYESYGIQNVVCYNIGRYRHVKWTCETDLPNDVEFGYADPICDGYRFEDDDEFVYRQSCVLEFSLYKATAYGGASSFVPFVLLCMVCCCFTGLFKSIWECISSCCGCQRKQEYIYQPVSAYDGATPIATATPIQPDSQPKYYQSSTPSAPPCPGGGGGGMGTAYVPQPGPTIINNNNNNNGGGYGNAGYNSGYNNGGWWNSGGGWGNNNGGGGIWFGRPTTYNNSNNIPGYHHSTTHSQNAQSTFGNFFGGSSTHATTANNSRSHHSSASSSSGNRSSHHSTSTTSAHGNRSHHRK